MVALTQLSTLYYAKSVPKTHDYRFCQSVCQIVSYRKNRIMNIRNTCFGTIKNDIFYEKTHKNATKWR